MAFQLSLRPQTLTKLRRIRPLSSSTPLDSSSAAVSDPSSAAAPPPPPSCASPSSDIKDHIFKKSHLDKPSFAVSDDPKRTDHSFDFIRENLRKFTGVQPLKPSSRGLGDLTPRFTPPIKTDQLPSSIFGKEKPTDDADPKFPKTEKEFREKLRWLLAEVGDNPFSIAEVGDNPFSIAELNDRLVKFRELEEKVADSIAELNDRLVKFRELEEKVADSIAELNDRPVESRTGGQSFRKLREHLNKKTELNDRLVESRTGGRAVFPQTPRTPQ